MSPSGLHVFLSGSRPHPSTLQKIGAWAARTHLARGSIDSRDVEAAIALIHRYVDSAPNEKEAATRLDKVLARLQR